MLRLAAAAVVLLAPPAQAHEFDELVIASHGPSTDRFHEIRLQDTVAGREIVCALYDSAGKLLASNDWRTDNLATAVLIRYEGDHVASVRCVFND